MSIETEFDEAATFLRHGEWLFLPRPWLRVDDELVLKGEPIGRGNGTPHICQYMARGARAFVKGSVRHPDHKTIWLPYWHKVVMIRAQARPIRNVACLDGD